MNMAVMGRLPPTNTKTFYFRSHPEFCYSLKTLLCKKDISCPWQFSWPGLWPSTKNCTTVTHALDITWFFNLFWILNLIFHLLMTDNTINKSLVTIQYGNISPPAQESTAGPLSTLYNEIGNVPTAPNTHISTHSRRNRPFSCRPGQPCSQRELWQCWDWPDAAAPSPTTWLLQMCPFSQSGEIVES